MSMYCKACGGDLTRIGNYNVCQFCGNKWIIDESNDVHVVERANAWAALRDNDFEKASELFENILLKDANDPEAHWGMALSTHGIKYETDLNEKRKVPTCNNISEQSFLEDRRVQRAIALASSEVADTYRRQAEEIERIRLEWLTKARKEPPYDVFISFKDSDRENNIERTQDSYDASEIYNALVEAGYKVFFSRVSLRDKVSEHYEPYIYNAIKTAKVMIVFGEKAEYFNSVWIRNEWTRFRARIEKGEKHKNSLIVVYRNMDPADLPVALKSRQCMNAAAMTFLPDLIRHIKRINDDTAQAARLDRISIRGGQISRKVRNIAASSIQMRDLGVDNVAHTSVSDKQTLDIISSYINGSQWEDALRTIDQLLLHAPNNARALELRFITTHQVQNIGEFFQQVADTSFSDEDKARIEQILSAANKERAGELLDLMYKTNSYMPAETYNKILQTILPYNHDNRQERIREAFLVAIDKSQGVVFDTLLTTLQSYEVNTYIEYCLMYAQKNSSVDVKLTYLDKILAVDSGNSEALRMKFELKWGTANASDLSKTFEEILKYSSNINDEIAVVLDKICEGALTSKWVEFAKQVLKYYVGDLSPLANVLLKLSFLMIQSKLFADAQYMLNLMLTFECDQERVYWGLCLVKVKATSEDNILRSNIPLKEQPEYMKYLTLVNENRRQACFNLTNQQEKEIRKRRIIKRVCIAVGSVLAVALATAIALTQWVLPKKLFNQANDLLASNQYQEAMELYDQIGKMSLSSSQKAVISGIKEINNSKFESGIEAILNANVSVKLTCVMNGGDFSGNMYLGAPSNSGILLSSSSNSILLSSAAEYAETVEFNYTAASAFKGLQVPGRNGYSFVSWELEGYRYEFGGAFELKLKAVWSEKEYTVSYDLDGGIAPPENPIGYGIEDGFTLVNPTKPGYTFIGWTGTALDNLTMSVTVEKGSSGNKSYKANWTANIYNLTFDANGGTVDLTSASAAFGEKYILPVPTREGYTFDGWYEGEVQISSNGSNEFSIPDRDLALSAKWVANSYTITYEDTVKRAGVVVTFDYNYIGSTPTTVTLSNGDQLNCPKNPTRSGYLFAGWYTNSACTSAYNFKGSINDDITLYAGWSDCEISNDEVYPWTESGGILTSTNTAHNSSSAYRITATSSVTVSFSYKVSCEKDFDTLRIVKNGSEELVKSSGVDSYSYISYSVNLNAGESLEFVYAKDDDGSSGSDCAYIKDLTYVSNVSYESSAVANCNPEAIRKYSEGSTTSEDVVFGTSYELPAISRTGYSFLGWYNGDTKVESGTWAIASDVTLTPKWLVGGNTITLNANGGIATQSFIVVSYDQTYELPVPKRHGYTFDGWYNGDVEYTSGVWQEFSDVTLVAKWTVNTYDVTFEGVEEIHVTATVTYNYNYSGSTSTSETLVHGQTLYRPIDPVRIGYVFVGWYTDPGCTVRYDFTGAITDNMTLYAGWHVQDSGGHSHTNIDPSSYTSSSNEYQISNGNTSSGNQKYYYFAANESGTHHVYYRNGSSDRGTYIGITNLTQDTTIMEAAVCLSTVYASVAFDCNAGDVIVINVYMENTAAMAANAYFYFGGFGSSASSTAIVSLPEKVLKYKDGSVYTDSASHGENYVLPIPTRDGYTFEGWYCGDEKVESDALIIESAVTLTARWSLNTYTLTFDVDGGDVEVGYIDLAYGEEYTLPTPEKSGYTFEGWYNGDVPYTSGVWQELSDITLVAKWSVNTYNITFKDVEEVNVTVTVTYDYGSTSTTKTLYAGQTLDRPTDPVQNGYIFMGWYTDEECTQKYDFAGDITGDMTLYAGWQVQDSGGHSHTNIDPSSYYSNDSVYQTSSSETSSNDQKYIYFVANESGKHSISYKNSSSSIDNITCISITNLTQDTKIMEPTECTSTSYTRLEFECEAGDVIVIGVYKSSSPATVYFYFGGFSKPASSTAIVSLPEKVLKYSEGSEYTDTVEYGASYTLPVPVKDGYTFDGWQSGDTPYTDGAWLTPNDVTLEAKWILNE